MATEAVLFVEESSGDSPTQAPGMLQPALPANTRCARPGGQGIWSYVETNYEGRKSSENVMYGDLDQRLGPGSRL